MKKNTIGKIARVALGCMAMLFVATASTGCCITAKGGCNKGCAKKCGAGCDKPCCKKADQG